MMIAALFVERNGVYFDLPNVEPWDETKNAFSYSGPWPIVAHPPCTAWCALAALVEARCGHKRGEDGGCFAFALEAVRRFGGVLEHPAHSAAWSRFGLPIPARCGGWQRGMCGGWACYVEQSRYGHAARKGTWLYAFGVEPLELRWGFDSTRTKAQGIISGLRTGRPNVRDKHASRTPIEFRDALLSLARSVYSQRSSAA